MVNNMKITVKQLKTIINEEVSKLKEDSLPDSVSPGVMDLTQKIHAAIELCDQLGGSEKAGKRFKECEKHLLAAWKAAKGGPKI